MHGVETDEDGRIRLDDWEMRKEVQEEVMKIWKNIETETVKKYADVEGFWHDFYNMFGFDIDGVYLSLSRAIFFANLSLTISLALS